MSQSPDEVPKVFREMTEEQKQAIDAAEAASGGSLAGSLELAICVPLTPEEGRVLGELSEKTGLVDWRVMIQALRAYQLIATGHSKLVEVNPLPMMAPVPEGVRGIPQPDGGRVETGPVQFGTDWPGVFIRGDNAGWYAMTLKTLLERLTPEQAGFEGMTLKSLLMDLGDCIQGPCQAMVRPEKPPLTPEEQLRRRQARQRMKHTLFELENAAREYGWEDGTFSPALYLRNLAANQKNAIKMLETVRDDQQVVISELKQNLRDLRPAVVIQAMASSVVDAYWAMDQAFRADLDSDEPNLANAITALEAQLNGD